MSWSIPQTFLIHGRQYGRPDVCCQHADNVVLYHGIGFIRFPQEARTIAGGIKRGMNCFIFEKRQFACISPDEAVRRRDLPDCRFCLPKAILAA